MQHVMNIYWGIAVGFSLYVAVVVVHIAVVVIARFKKRE